jgi:hypothetical protein
MTASITCFLRDLRTPQASDSLCCSRRYGRRAFLCGLDSKTGKDFNHREDRIYKLADGFAVSVYAYAVAPAKPRGRFAR